MTTRRTPRRNPQIHPSEEGAGVTRCCSPSIHDEIEETEEGAGMSHRCSPRLNPQIHSSQEGAGVTRCCSCPRLHPQIQENEDGAGVTRRRSRSTSPAPAASLPEDDDMLREILLRLPPQPSSLPRASAVCRRWRGLVTDPKFHRQFHAHHRRRKPPPILGIFADSSQGIAFTPILDPPERIPPDRLSLGRCGNRADYSLLDCRHGLVLVKNSSRTEVLVCDPITGEQRCVAVPSELRRGFLKGAVLCAAAGDPGHAHGGCHFSCSYKVVLLSTATRHFQCLACVYSSETGLWGNLISMEGPYDYADDLPATLAGSCLYWSKGDDILEFDLDTQNLAVIIGPPVTNNGKRQIIQAAADDGAISYSILSYPRLELWRRNINAHGVATWVLWKTTELHTIEGLPALQEATFAQLMLGDDDDVLFLWYDRSVYMVQLESMRSRKLDGIPSTMNRYRPFKSFFAPGTTTAGGFNAAEMLNIG